MRLTSVLLPLLLSFSLGGHAQHTAPPAPAPKSSALDSALFYQLLLGELSAGGEDSGAAFSLVLDAARKIGDPGLYRRAVQLAVQARAGESALQAAKAWSLLLPASAEANRQVLQILLALNRIAETREPLTREIALTAPAQRRELLWRLPALYESAKDRQLAAAIVQQVLTGLLADPELGATAWAVAGRFWLAADDKAAALQAATQGLALDVKSEHPALLALTMMSPEVPQAESLVKLHLPHARPEFHMAYIKALLQASRETDVKAELARLKTSAPDYPDTWLIEAVLALQQRQLDQAEPSLLRYLDLQEAKSANDPAPELKRGRSQALMSLAQIAEWRKEPQTAAAWLQQIDNPDDLLRADIQRAVLMAHQGQLEEALALVQSRPERSESDARVKRSAEIALLREFKLFERARDKLQAAVAHSPQDTDAMYELAMIHEKLGDLTDMERLLRDLIALNPQDPQAYNALGYSLADRNLRLPEAKALISKALELSPGDPFITDSLAWVEFRSGNLEAALGLLQTAFNNKPDAEIAAHLGEVLWASQRQPEALEFFRQGMKLNPDNETLRETLKRLRVAL